MTEHAAVPNTAPDPSLARDRAPDPASAPPPLPTKGDGPGGTGFQPVSSPNRSSLFRYLRARRGR